MASVRAATLQDAVTCAAIVAGLSDFFTDDVPDKVRSDLRDHGGWVIDDAGDVVGFAIVQRRGMRAAEILWAAVAADRRGAGLGTRLVIPDYPLAPEHTWRESHDALVDLVTRCCAESSDGVVLAGDSAGGGLALAIAQGVRDRSGPQPDRMLLHSPWVDLTTSTPDTDVVTLGDPWLFIGKLRAYAAWWAGAEEDLGRPEVSPALG